MVGVPCGSSTVTGTFAQIDLNGANPNIGTSDPGSGTLTIATGATFNDQTTNSGLSIIARPRAGSDTGATAAVNNAGTLIKSGSATTSTISTLFNNTGTVDVQSGTLAITGNINNSGALQADGGNIRITSTMTDGGSATIGDNSQIEFGNVSNERITFEGVGGTLRLDVSSSFTGQVSGLDTNDFIDLADMAFGANTTVGYTGDATGGVLTVTSGAHVANIALLGNYLASTFTASSDGHGGTMIVDPVSDVSSQLSALTQPQHM